MGIVDMFKEFMDQLNTLGQISIFVGGALVIILVLTIVFTWRNTRKIKKSMAKLRLEQGDIVSNLNQANEYLKYLCQAKEFELKAMSGVVGEKQPRPAEKPVITPEPPAPQVPLPEPQPIPQTVPEAAPQTAPEQQPLING